MKRRVTQFIRNCQVCQAAKYDNAAKPGLLQPLPIPEEVWCDVSMDFISGLLASNGKDVIFVVVDRLSKYAHFVPLSHPYTAIQVAQAYLDNIFKLHGWPRSIVSDRDAVFLSTFWKGLFSLHGTEFLMSSSYHPETDGQTEVVNRCLETYLRCMCGDSPKDWCLWLPLAEWWYNTHFHTSINMTPYEVVYNQPPSLHLPYLPRESDVEVVDRSMIKREAMIAELKFQLEKAQSRMKVQADKKRSERSFEIGDWVWLKLQPYRQQSVQRRVNQKLAWKNFGPFQVVDKIGKVAYKLKLPADSLVHDVFHVSQLKKFYGTLPMASQIPPWFYGRDVSEVLQPAAILERRTVKQQNKAVVQYLVQWEGYAEFEAT
ncbi:Ty3/gypsy retrotransposon protein [Melia azedarach]|uniref:Ty3/gypsy retrotransposon protein n=1 Tax=Melia azedarach TaxID=155640 RepID=A0ACC1X185_MELAZ|nr:Ty3/gypsy retrotransposon protein [Melia azedarach]